MAQDARVAAPDRSRIDRTDRMEMAWRLHALTLPGPNGMLSRGATDRRGWQRELEYRCATRRGSTVSAVPRRPPGTSTTRRWQRRARGEDVILLSIGDPDFPTPAPIVAAAKASLDRGRTHYAAAGRPARAALGHRRRATSACRGSRVDPSQVVVLAGAQSALFTACQCLLRARRRRCWCPSPCTSPIPRPSRRPARGSCGCRCWPSAASISISRPWRRR